MAEFSFTKEDRVRKSFEFKRITRFGKIRQTRNFRIFLHPNGLDRNRLGFIVSRRVGNAVVRNRIKRVLREFFRLNRKLFPDGQDVVIAVRPGVGWVTLDLVRGELEPALSRKRKVRKNRQ